MLWLSGFHPDSPIRTSFNATILENATDGSGGGAAAMGLTAQTLFSSKGLEHLKEEGLKIVRELDDPNELLVTLRAQLAAAWPALRETLWLTGLPSYRHLEHDHTRPSSDPIVHRIRLVDDRLLHDYLLHALRRAGRINSTCGEDPPRPQQARCYSVCAIQSTRPLSCPSPERAATRSSFYSSTGRSIAVRTSRASASSSSLSSRYSTRGSSAYHGSSSGASPADGSPASFSSLQWFLYSLDTEREIMLQKQTGIGDYVHAFSLCLGVYVFGINGVLFGPMLVCVAKLLVDIASDLILDAEGHAGRSPANALAPADEAPGAPAAFTQRRTAAAAPASAFVSENPFGAAPAAEPPPPRPPTVRINSTSNQPGTLRARRRAAAQWQVTCWARCEGSPSSPRRAVHRAAMRSSSAAAAVEGKLCQYSAHAPS